jgi:3-oxoacyl-[acyl-carrier-protein] synthase-1
MAEQMIPVYAVATHAVSALGADVSAHWQAIRTMRTGLKRYDDRSMSPQPFWASMPDPAIWQLIHNHTRTAGTLTPFEQLACYTARAAMANAEMVQTGADTAFILSTTKGNIELLHQVPDERLRLGQSAQLIARALGIKGNALVVSHACVSGVIALQYGLGLIRSGRYRRVVVTGCDRFSRFVLSGFSSFHAIADEPCRPFDAARKGINLGEAAATIILSADPGEVPIAELVSGASSNDANHISGPSRTGDELAVAIARTLRRAGITPQDIDMISAHGTATVYNDEMEAKAFHTTGLAKTPVHSLKGFVGHTLGAAGVLESVVTIESLRHQMLVPSPGYDQNGVSKSLNITRSLEPARIRYALKTASGFGGSNAVLIWKQP